jgi:hypothetical protein
MMKALALPTPSLARHLARTIDGRSLTGVPGAWSTPIKRKPFRKTRAKKPAPSWEIIVHNPASAKMRLWFMTSVFTGGSITQSVVLASNKREATRLHLQVCREKHTHLNGLAHTTIGFVPGRCL